MNTDTYATWTDVVPRVCGYVPFGEWLGSAAEEGRAKQRYVLGRRMEPLNQQLPNRTS